MLGAGATKAVAEAGSGTRGIGARTLGRGTCSLGSSNTGGNFNVNAKTVTVGAAVLTGGVDGGASSDPVNGGVRVGFGSNPNDISLGVIVVAGGSTLTIRNATLQDVRNGAPTLFSGYGNQRQGRFKGGGGLITSDEGSDPTMDDGGQGWSRSRAAGC